MKAVGMFILGLLVIGALAFWIRETVGFPTLHTPTIASLVGTTTQTASVANAVTDGNYVDITGTILLDTSSGTSVPFLEYATPDHGVATKQLVYANSRACAAYAGDLPCVDVNPNQGYPQYPTGMSVRVRGLHVADRILVYQIDPL